MTTSFITSTVSPDIVITTPAQLTQAFKLWVDGFLVSGDEVSREDFEDPDVAAAMAQQLMEYLNYLNQGGV